LLRFYRKEPLPEPAGDAVLTNFDIEFSSVSFSYEQEPVLKNASFKIPEKSITALVGPSGAGKTTIANLIARFWDVDSGEVKIGGAECKGYKTGCPAQIHLHRVPRWSFCLMTQLWKTSDWAAGRPQMRKFFRRPGRRGAMILLKACLSDILP